MNLSFAKKTVISLIKDAQKHSDQFLEVDAKTALIGSKRALDSMGLVQLCLALEDKASDLGFDFDWTSDDAMSKSKGMYRSVEALAKEFFDQYSKQK